ncbi:hypothetical protein BDA96_05G238800 [Sorghum bicolor]|uniref:Uncharacterized protein n=2 Tax=Sorghum bicolor TaxID=4558 RepID=A0A921UIH1_SORBI|nr:hypothetical protein BDA96_05G238800 [Sorghum bicolor]KXG29174.1 hypothetical protein SORBI_3005G222800 [Sorghum bicolor]
MAAKQPTAAFTPRQRSLCGRSDVDTSETADVDLRSMDGMRKASTKTDALRRLHLDCKSDLLIGRDVRIGRDPLAKEAVEVKDLSAPESICRGVEYSCLCHGCRRGIYVL